MHRLEEKEMHCRENIGQQTTYASGGVAPLAFGKLSLRPGHSPHGAASQAPGRLVSSVLRLALTQRHNLALGQTLWCHYPALRPCGRHGHITRCGANVKWPLTSIRIPAPCILRILRGPEHEYQALAKLGSPGIPQGAQGSGNAAAWAVCPATRRLAFGHTTYCNTVFWAVQTQVTQTTGASTAGIHTASAFIKPGHYEWQTLVFMHLPLRHTPHREAAVRSARRFVLQPTVVCNSQPAHFLNELEF